MTRILAEKWHRIADIKHIFITALFLLSSPFCVLWSVQKTDARVMWISSGDAFIYWNQHMFPYSFHQSYSSTPLALLLIPSLLPVPHSVEICLLDSAQTQLRQHTELLLLSQLSLILQNLSRIKWFSEYKKKWSRINENNNNLLQFIV